MMIGLAAEHCEQTTVMIDATYLKAHRTASSLGVKKGGRGRLSGRTKGGMNTKLHAICDSYGRPLNLFVTAGQVSDYIGARALLSGLSDVEWLLGDRGYDADWFREALNDKGITDLMERSVYTGHVEFADWGIPLRKGYNEPIISLETFQRVQERRSCLNAQTSTRTLSCEVPCVVRIAPRRIVLHGHKESGRNTLTMCARPNLVKAMASPFLAISWRVCLRLSYVA